MSRRKKTEEKTVNETPEKETLKPEQTPEEESRETESSVNEESPEKSPETEKIAEEPAEPEEPSEPDVPEEKTTAENETEKPEESPAEPEAAEKEKTEKQPIDRTKVLMILRNLMILLLTVAILGGLVYGIYSATGDRIRIRQEEKRLSDLHSTVRSADSWVEKDPSDPGETFYVALQKKKICAYVFESTGKKGNVTADIFVALAGSGRVLNVVVHSLTGEVYGISDELIPSLLGLTLDSLPDSGENEADDAVIAAVRSAFTPLKSARDTMYLRGYSEIEIDPITTAPPTRATTAAPETSEPATTRPETEKTYNTTQPAYTYDTGYYPVSPVTLPGGSVQVNPTEVTTVYETETLPPETTEPESTDLESTEPETTEPETTDPESTEPESNEPETTEPLSTEPESTEPETTEPETTEPETTEPLSTEPETTEPESTEPETTEPETTEPETTEPETTEPETTEPESTDPETTEPETTET